MLLHRVGVTSAGGFCLGDNVWGMNVCSGCYLLEPVQTIAVNVLFLVMCVF